MRILALDAMGSDRAPAPEVEGAVRAVRAHDLSIILTGDSARLRDELARHGASPDVERRIQIHHARETVNMNDAAGTSARRRETSMRLCFELARDGKADAVISAGHSGAMMACALFVWGRQSGVERPALIATLPTRRSRCALIDMGANVECRPSMLAQFAVMGAAYMRAVHGVERPRVGVLSNGTEPGKGTQLVRDAIAMLERPVEAGKNFELIGHVEGRDLVSGLADVVVTDGFTGNVALKAAEGVAQLLWDSLRDELTSSMRGKIGAMLAKPRLKAMQARIGHEKEGGAPLVGVDGLCLVAHGSSNAVSIEHALVAASRLADSPLRARVAESISSHATLWS